MTPRPTMTLTTLGLSLRDETLVKSLLNIVGGNTRAQWRFVDEIDADLALCDPASPFARMALQKSERSGSRCADSATGGGQVQAGQRNARGGVEANPFRH